MEPKKPIRAVIFDLDGTLLNTLEDLAHSMNRVLESHGFPTHRVEAYKSFIGQGIETLVRRALPSSDHSPGMLERCEADMRRQYRRHWADTTRPYEGIPELLDYLHERGLPMAILTNKPHDFALLNVERLLARWTFDEVLGGGGEWPLKPDPAGAREILRRLDVEPSRCLYLGDTPVDMQTATAAGIFPVGVLWGFREAAVLKKHGARTLITHPRELDSLLT